MQVTDGVVAPAAGAKSEEKTTVAMAITERRIPRAAAFLTGVML